jgi:hypothetical protein
MERKKPLFFLKSDGKYCNGDSSCISNPQRLIVVLFFFGLSVSVDAKYAHRISAAFLAVSSSRIR